MPSFLRARSARTAHSAESVTVAIQQFLASAQASFSFQTILVALSGGKDSRCLLAELSQQYDNSLIHAIYIDHNLQQESARWGELNRQFCESLGVTFETIKVEVDLTKASLEQQARQARYQALAEKVTANCCLVTGHHQSDQAETFLLQLFRGAGSKGLAAMPLITKFSAGYHARPLLNVSSKAIDDYVQQHGLSFIEDPSNQDLSIRRNYLRQRLIPAIEQLWPQVSRVIAKASKLQADNQTLLDEVAADDLLVVAEKNCLLIDKLNALTRVRQNNLLRYWLAQSNLLMPSENFLEQIREQLVTANVDANPLLAMADFSLRRYQQKIYLVKESRLVLPEKKEWIWTLDGDFKASEDLMISIKKLKKLYPELLAKQLKVTLRQEGESWSPPNKKHSQTIKNYLQERQVPPWLRAQTLLVWEGGKVILVQEKTL